MEIIWSPLSLEDIEEIGNFIAEDSPSNAISFVNEIIKAVERLEKYPESGPITEEHPMYRYVVHKGYPIIYFLEIERINITTVLSPGKLFT